MTPFAMIMAGGSGTRLWPMSRRDRPKQLLPLPGGGTLLELAFRRLEGLVPAERRLICAGRRHREAILEALPAARRRRFLGEPEGRDTAAAIGLTAAVLAREEPDAIFAVLTADHLIEPTDVFRRCLGTGLAIVDADRRRFVTFAIRPTYPATGFGYVRRGDPLADFPEAQSARDFLEKPGPERARQFLADGSYAWNSGMFVFPAAALLEALRRHLPATHEGVTRIAAAWETPQRDEALEAVYPTLPKISVDHGVMEPAARDPAIELCVVDMDVAWIDVGSWPAYAGMIEADEHGNRSTCAAVHLDSRNVLAAADDPAHTIATVNCADLIVVRCADATLVCPAADAQRIKELAALVPERLL